MDDKNIRDYSGNKLPHNKQERKDTPHTDEHEGMYEGRLCMDRDVQDNLCNTLPANGHLPT